MSGSRGAPGRAEQAAVPSGDLPMYPSDEGRTGFAAKKVFIKTFGCQMNEYDSDKMADVLRVAKGYEPTTDVEQADLILFNTCSVREKAQEKVFSDLGRVKHLKEKGVLIGVGGCVASQEGAAIVERAPYVDLVFGPQTLHRLPQMIDSFKASGKVASFLISPPSQTFHVVKADANNHVTNIRYVRDTDILVNCGFFVFRKDIFDYMRPGEELVLDPFRRLIEADQLMAFRAERFYAMDTFKEQQELTDLFERGEAAWEVWKKKAEPLSPPVAAATATK